MDKTVRIPGPDHPITIAPVAGRVSVTLGGTRIADSSRALALKEADYPEVLYIPREDARMDLLARTSHSTHCPYKGDAAYYSIPSGGARSANAVWTYEQPHEAVAAIANHLAFYPDRVDAIDKV
jgi:uncharacterized protein (DUF427 family)